MHSGSLELLVICDEIVSWLKSLMKGEEISEETLALDLIHQHGLTGDFVGTDHTLRYMRDCWEPRLVNRQNYDQWVQNGATSMRDRAKAKINEILSAEPQRILPRDVESRIRKIADRAATAQ